MMKMGAGWSSVRMGCAGKRSYHTVVPRSPHRSLTRKPGGTTNCRRHLRWRAREGDSLSERLPSAQPGKDETMQVIHERCAGLDVHKKKVYACIIVPENNGKKKQEVRSFDTMTADLLKLAEWLRERAVTHVAMEATGVFW